jgi:hypothetical protein
MTLNDASLYIWHQVRDQIAENVPGFDTLTGYAVAEMCWFVLQHAVKHPDATWQALDKVRDEYMSTGDVKR